MLKLKNLTIPLSFFDNCSALYPAQVKYLTTLQNRETNSSIKERIGTLLAKPHIPCPIASYNANIDYSKYKKQKHPYPASKPIINPITISSKINIWQVIINFIKKLFVIRGEV